ncbi:MAG: SpaA isopeptide-forming pilin-related protein, partial [Erysipelotrichaceae bacterium]
MEFMKTKYFKVAILATVAATAIFSMLFLRNLQDTTTAINEESPFYSNESGDNLFTVRGYGDLFVNVIRKDDGTGNGPLAFCLNKQKTFPTNDSRVIYESKDKDDWTWELDNLRTPSAAQVEQVQRALYAYKYIYPDKLAEYGLAPNDTMSLYHAEQIAQWTILENWTPDMVVVKDNVKDKPQLLALANKIHALYQDIYYYAMNQANSSYAEGIKVVLNDTNTKADYTYKNNDFITTSTGQGYFRSGLMEAIPNQLAGYHREGGYAFTYKVTPGTDAPSGTRIVNENGTPQDTFSTNPGVGLEFYVDTPVEAIAGNSGTFNVNIQTTMFRRNAGILWRPVSQTAYQTLVQNASVPDASTSTIAINYAGIGKISQVEIKKEGEQLNSFQEVTSPYGTIHKPTYKVLPLSGTKYTIEMQKETENGYFIDGEDGVTYYHGQNLVSGGTVLTGVDGIAKFNRLPLAKDTNTTSYRVIEKEPSNGFTLSNTNSKVVQVDKTSKAGTILGKTNFVNDRIAIDFTFQKKGEYIANKDTKEIKTKNLSGVVFGVYTNEVLVSADGTSLPKDSLVGVVTSDASGKVSGKDLNLPSNHQFYLSELKTDDSLTLDTAHYILDTTALYDAANPTKTTEMVSLKNETGQVVNEIVNRLKLGSLSVEKQVEVLQDDGGLAYQTINDGADYEFAIYQDEAKTNLVTKTTSSMFTKGKFVIDNLTPGTYYVEETKANQNYEINKRVSTVVVNPLEITNTVIKNDLKTVSYDLHKYDISSGNRKAFQGVTFDLKYKNNVISSFTTKADGSVRITGSKVGYEYTLEERVPSGYEKIVNDTIFLHPGTDTNLKLEIENKKIINLSSIHLIKNDATSKKMLENVGFAIYRSDDTNFTNALKEDVTDKNGSLTFNKLSPDTYIIRETIPLNGYLPIEDIVVDLTKATNGNIKEIEVQNTKFYADVLIQKINAETGKGLANAKLGFYASETEVNPIATVVTNEMGKANIANVPYGLYYLGEIEAPAGFEKSNKRVLVDVTDMKQKEVSVQFKNNPIIVNLQLVKRSEDTNDLLPEAKFKLYEDDNGKKGTYITTLTTNAKGEAKAKIYQKKYILEETLAPLGYQLANTN